MNPVLPIIALLIVYWLLQLAWALLKGLARAILKGKRRLQSEQRARQGQPAETSAAPVAPPPLWDESPADSTAGPPPSVMIPTPSYPAPLPPRPPAPPAPPHRHSGSLGELEAAIRSARDRSGWPGDPCLSAAPLVALHDLLLDLDRRLRALEARGGQDYAVVQRQIEVSAELERLGAYLDGLGAQPAPGAR